MALFLISYDLNKEGKDYTGLIKEIDKLGDVRKPLESTFVVKTNLETHVISARLRMHLDEDDAFLVIQVTSDATGRVYPEDFWKWIISLR